MLAFETTAPQVIRRPLTTTAATLRSGVTSIDSTRHRIRTSTPLETISSFIAPTSASVPPSNVNTPLLMKLEKTMP